MNKYRHKILGFEVLAGKFPNGYEKGYIIQNRNGIYPKVRLHYKFWKDIFYDDYIILGYWLHIDKKIYDVDFYDYLIIRRKMIWIEKNSEFYKNYEEVTEDE